MRLKCSRYQVGKRRSSNRVVAGRGGVGVRQLPLPSDVVEKRRLTSHQIPPTEDRVGKDVFHIMCWNSVGWHRIVVEVNRFSALISNALNPMSRAISAGEKMTAEDEGGQTLHAFSCM